LRINAQAWKFRNERFDEIERVRAESAGNAEAKVPALIFDGGEICAGAFGVEWLAMTAVRVEKYISDEAPS